MNSTDAEDAEKRGGELAGRVALVTGAGVGIGAAIARTLAGAGAFVGIHYRESRDGAEEVLQEIRESGGEGVLLQADLEGAENCRRIVDQLVGTAGSLSILVNNAGGPIERVRIEDCPLELWNRILSVNLTSAFVVTQSAAKHLRAAGNGAIVNNLSLSVQTGGAHGAGPYAIAKGGLGVLTRTLARELAPQVRCNSIMPGVIETRHHEMFSTPERMEQYRRETPLARNGTADEVAAAVLFLVSDSARFVNGAIIDISGGRFLR